MQRERKCKVVTDIFKYPIENIVTKHPLFLDAVNTRLYVLKWMLRTCFRWCLRCSARYAYNKCCSDSEGGSCCGTRLRQGLHITIRLLWFLLHTVRISAVACNMCVTLWLLFAPCALTGDRQTELAYFFIPTILTSFLCFLSYNCFVLFCNFIFVRVNHLICVIFFSFVQICVKRL